MDRETHAGDWCCDAQLHWSDGMLKLRVVCSAVGALQPSLDRVGAGEGGEAGNGDGGTVSAGGAPKLTAAVPSPWLMTSPMPI